MEPNERVLSDVHIDMSHTRPIDYTDNLDVKQAGFLALFIVLYLSEVMGISVLCSTDDTISKKFLRM